MTLPVNPSVAGLRPHIPGGNGCYTLNRTEVRLRAYGLTEKAHRELARLELLRVFGDEPMPSGVPHHLVPRKEMGR